MKKSKKITLGIISSILLILFLVLIFNHSGPHEVLNEFGELVLNNEEYNLTITELNNFKNEIEAISTDSDKEPSLLQKKYVYLGYLESLLSNPEVSKKYYEKAFELGENKDPIVNYLMLTIASKSFVESGEIEKANYIFSQTLLYAEQISNDLVAKTYQAYARNLVTYNHGLDRAINLTKKSLEIESSHETRIYNHLYLSILYLFKGEYSCAISQATIAFEESVDHNLTTLKYSSVKRLADIYYVQRKFNQAVTLYERLFLSDWERLAVRDKLSSTAHLSDAYALINKFDLAHSILNEYFTLINEIPDYNKPAEYHWGYLQQAKNYLLENRLEEAKSSMEEANFYAEISPEMLFVTSDVWTQQLNLDIELAEEGPSLTILENYISLLSELITREIRDDLYYTILDRVIEVGQLLGQVELVIPYMNEKITALQANEESNYDGNLSSIIESFQAEDKLAMINSLKNYIIVIGGVSVLLVSLLGYIHVARLRIKKLNQQLYEQTIIDYLTKVYNKRYLYQYLNQITKSPQQVGLMLLDIDYFKLYNDTYGHLAGDKILEQVALLLKEVFKNDAVFRYGGEEFCIVTTADDLKFKDKVSQFYKQLEELNLEHRTSRVRNSISVSAGIHFAILSQSDDYTNFLNLADKKLYEAKENGRNQFII